MPRMPRLASGVFVAFTACAGASPGRVPAPTAPAAASPPEASAAGAATPGPAAAVAASEPASGLAASHGQVAHRIIAAALVDGAVWDKLAHLTDRVGPRLSGSEALDRAIAWAVASLRDDGHENVRAETVMVPHWVRGAESLALEAPLGRRLPVLGLGGTVATPPRGVRAEVVSVASFDELDALGEASVRGKIVLFDKVMADYTYETAGEAYGEAIEYRTDGASRAAKLGAVAVLVRSVTTRSLRTLHTGGVRYTNDAPKIPAAAVATEDAAWISRLIAAGDTVRVRLVTSGRFLNDAASANVIGELVGSELPGEVVVIGAHIDSWDVGQGAHDDGAGCAIVMQALTVLRELGLRPRRTVRVVLFTNEENGLRGAFEYARAHAGEVARHVTGIEADTGGFRPVGFRVQGGDPAAFEQVRAIASLLGPVGAARVEAGYSGADLTPLIDRGMPALGLWVDDSHYFDVHHTEADTLDKVDPMHLRMNVAAVAVMAYVLADMPARFGAASAGSARADR